MALNDQLDALRHVASELPPSLHEYATTLIRKCHNEILRSTWFVAQASAICESAGLPKALPAVLDLMGHALWNTEQVRTLLEATVKLSPAQVVVVLRRLADSRMSFCEFAAHLSSSITVEQEERVNEWGQLVVLVALLLGKSINEALWLLWDTRNAKHKIQQLLDAA